MSHTVEVCPDSTSQRIRTWLRDHPEIAKDRYDATDGRVTGHCYVASEAYFYANGGEDSELGIYCLSQEDGTHWYLRRGETWIDLGIEIRADAERIPHANGQKRAFITGYEPSKRAERINTDLELW